MSKIGHEHLESVANISNYLQHNLYPKTVTVMLPTVGHFFANLSKEIKAFLTTNFTFFVV